MDKKKTVIGTYPLTNTGGVLVHEIDYYEDRVLASMNDDEPEWYDMTEQYWENTERNETGFCIGELFVPFCEVMRTQILGGAAFCRFSRLLFRAGRGNILHNGRGKARRNKNHGGLPS